MRNTTTHLAVAAVLGALTFASPSWADHNSFHSEDCNESDTVGGGELGNSPGGGTLGWDVGSGQCNGSFVVTRAPDFQGGSDLELGLRVEQRRTGQIEREDGNVYVVETGADNTGGDLDVDRAWWNFQISAGLGDLTALKELTLTIETISGPNQPSLPVFDLLPVAGTGGARGGPGTTEYPSLFQLSQNPEFGWFVNPTDGDANPTGAFDYDAEGIWKFTLEAKPQDGKKARVSMCVRTRGAGPLNNSANPCEGGKSKKSEKSKKSKKSEK